VDEARSEPLGRLVQGLAAAALTPKLRSILLFNADGEMLSGIAELLRRLLNAATGREVTPVRLGGSPSEDDLWVTPRLAFRAGRPVVENDPGLLLTAEHSGLPLIVVPDLAVLGLPVARGLVAVLGADTASLERHGTSWTWQPDACWLAACDRAATGRVSPHLIDRFALRLDASQRITDQQRVAIIQRWLDRGSTVLEVDDTVIAKMLHRLRDHSGEWPEVAGEALARVFDFLPTNDSVGHRREITLVRLAVALARLQTPHGQVTANHVTQAAELIGLATTTPPKAQLRQTTEESAAGASKGDPTRSPIPSTTTGTASKVAASPMGAGLTADEELVFESDAAETLDEAMLPNVSRDPYPEDHAPIERDASALKLASPRRGAATIPRGPIIGVQPTRTTQDLALLATVLTAAKWQPYRRAQATSALGALPTPPDAWMQLWPTDLRSYRRAPIPEQLLALLVDYTCLAGWDWSTSLLSHLRWAYVERAGVCLVRVGAADSRVDVRADRLATRNVLDPRLDTMLVAGPGRATPLAHGLFLVLQALRHGLQHGQGVVRRARLVVITDARGNVPLRLGPDLQMIGPVGVGGIEDTISVAREIRALPTVETVLVDPKPEFYPNLVGSLALALGATVEQGHRLQPTETL
jgi:magnesium chelatase subunit D